jgi:hypothetical protein
MSTAPLQPGSHLAAMKRYEVWLALIVGIVLGLTAKSFFARHSGAGNARTVPPAKAIDSAASVTTVNETQSADTPADSWMRRSLANFDAAIRNQPTPGIVDAISDALRAEAPFDQARMLMLIELMRKEDFPPVLEVLRKAKTNINSGSGYTGPSMWMAFWTRFGELDPATALAKALECGDLKYTGRKYLEKGLFLGMSRNNPRAAAEAFLAHPEIPNRDTAAEGIMVEWARTDPKAATAWALEHLEGGALSAGFYTAAWGVCGPFDISAGNTFTENLPPGPAQFNAIRGMKSQINQKGHLPAQQILDFIEVTRAVGSRDRGFEAQMASRCAGIDAFAAANYFSQPLANGEQNDFKELGVVSEKWIKADPKAAESWAKSQEGTPHYEVIANQFLHAAQERNDDAEVQRWLEAIEKQRKPKSAAQ